MRVKGSFLIAFLIVALSACGGGDKQGSSTFDATAELAKVKQARDVLNTARDELAATRTELAGLESKSRLSDEEQARKAELELQVKALEDRFDEAYNADQAALANFLNVALNDLPQAPETLEALELYASEAIRNAKERIAKAGDYGRAIDQLETAKQYFDAIQAPVPTDLQAAIDEATSMRYLTRERFDQVKKGMSEDDVKLIVGTPFYANIRENEVRGKKIVTWLYTRDDNEVAALYFQNGKVYATKWNVKEQ